MEFDGEIYRSIQSAVIDAGVRHGGCATHREIKEYVREKYGGKYEGDGTIGRRVRELVEARILMRESPGKFAVVASQLDGEVRKMRISELNAGRVSSVAGELVEIGDERTTQNGDRFCEATLRDDTGSVRLSLWNRDASLFKVGQRIEITNGWAKEYQGKLQLSAGKMGKIRLFGPEAIITKVAPPPEFPVGTMDDATPKPPKSGLWSIECPECHAALHVKITNVG
jgi:replication factor A1